MSELRECPDIGPDGEVVYRWKVPNDFPRNECDDIAFEYLVTKCDSATGGVIVYARYGNEWEANPWSVRPLVNRLVAELATRPPESALRKRVGELEELLKTAEDVLSNEDSNDQFRLETAGLIRAKLGINPACKTKSLERFGVFLPAPPETEA
jgi:hypothetical protein